MEEIPDITIEELRRTLSEKGLSFGFGTIKGFFARHEIPVKKGPPTPRSRIGPTS